jgi:carbamoylphosphate synthase large subunit
LKIRKEIFNHAEILGNFIYREYNYRGFFGLDFVVDEDANEVFLMEINPRITGSSALSSHLYQNQGFRLPLFLFHCLEFMGVRM